MRFYRMAMSLCMFEQGIEKILPEILLMLEDAFEWLIPESEGHEERAIYPPKEGISGTQSIISKKDGRLRFFEYW